MGSHGCKSVVAQAQDNLDATATWTIIAELLAQAVATAQQHRHYSSYTEHPWTRYLLHFTMHSRTSSIMLKICYPSSLAACASHNPGSKSTVGCVRTRSYTCLERGLNRFTSQDRKGLGRRWIFFRIPC